jgi:hypothetical protein
MAENILDNELKRIHKSLPFLWDIHGFHMKYFTRSYGIYHKGYIIGIENDVCRLVFEKETTSIIETIRIYTGSKSALFKPPDYSHLPSNGWYSVLGLLYWLTGVECERFKNVDQDLESTSSYLALYIDNLLELFKFPTEFDSKLQYYRNLHKDNQITIEKIRAERARLHSLGQDSSLEAAIKNLRGGQHE